jgi:hypothetical protein
MKTELSLFRFAGFRLAPAEIMRLVFVFSLANALWSPLSPRDRAWVDRIEIFIRGLEYRLVGIAFLLQSSVLSVLLMGAGTLGIIFGRIVWEGKS